MFETSGRQFACAPYGKWVASAPSYMQEEMLEGDSRLKADWDDVVGDRMIRLCIIGKNLDKKDIYAKLDQLLS